MKVNSDLINALTRDFPAVASADPRTVSGAVQFATAIITLTANGAAADVWDLIKLPNGAQIMPDQIFLIPVGGAYTLTGKLGDGLDDDRYGAGIAIDTAADKRANALDKATTLPAAMLTPFNLTDGARTLSFTLTAADNLTDGDALMFRIGYRYC